MLCVYQVNAQEISNQTLLIGDRAPEVKAHEWLRGDKFSVFEKGRIYVVEFGATWCAPCRQAIPKLTNISNRYGRDVTVISFFVMEHNSPGQGPTSYVERVRDYVARQGNKIEYSVAVDGPDNFMQKQWLVAANRQGIPQIFLIDRHQRIVWIGTDTNTLQENITALLDNGTLPKGREGSTSDTKAGLPDPIFSALLSAFRLGQLEKINNAFLSSYGWFEPNSVGSQKGTLEIYGESLRRLYYIAYADTLYNFPPDRSLATQLFPDTIQFPYHKRSYGKYWHKPEFELQDSTAFDVNYKLAKNRFNYFLKLPPSIASAASMQQAMQRDLQTYFGYDVRVEEREMPCWNMTLGKNFDRKMLSPQDQPYRYEIDAKGNYHYYNAEIRDIIFQLEIRYGKCQNVALLYESNLQPPFIDATGITGKINYTLLADDVNEIISSYHEGREYPFDKYRTLLRSLGFELVKSTRKMRVVTIRDPKL